jgi:hypothetical protein
MDKVMSCQISDWNLLWGQAEVGALIFFFIYHGGGCNDESQVYTCIAEKKTHMYI